MTEALEHLDTSKEYAERLDQSDPLARYRREFALPSGSRGTPVVYMCGNSLGLMPLSARTYVQREMDDWARLGVEGHFQARTPWYSYHEVFREAGARLVGANPGEVVMMNSLTVNLHLMLVSFFRPEGKRNKVLIEPHAFPSDRYALQSQLEFHGLNPKEHLIEIEAAGPDASPTSDEIRRSIEKYSDELALVLVGGVNFFTGRRFDLPAIVQAARKAKATVGFDLAHGAGNVPYELHDWDVDFAVWCSYKYLNAGPGAVAGCFVHEKHAMAKLPRFAGWWGNDPAKRFEMDKNVWFEPFNGAEGWQVSNPSVLSMAPLKASLELFEAAGMAELRTKSVRLTGYLYDLLATIPEPPFEIITPSDPQERGCQLSLRIANEPRGVFDALREKEIVADFREPDVIRVAPVPLYNSFVDVWRVFDGIRGAVSGDGK